MRVLAFGSYDAEVHPRVAVLLAGLRAAGAQVDEVNAPLGLDTQARVAVLRSPRRLPRLAVAILRSWWQLVRRSRAHRDPDVVLVGYLGHFDVLLARRLFRRAVVVHDLMVFGADTAVDRGADGLKVRALRRLDAAAVRASDVVVLDTEEHRQLLPEERRQDGVVVAVGVPEQWRSPRPEPRTGPLRVVFFGLYTPLQGAPTIGRALALLGHELAGGLLEVTMVGRGQDLEQTRALAGEQPGVTWLPWVEPADLPAVVAAHDVCLGVFGESEKARRVVPNKVFQGAAAGCGLVTSDTPPQRRALGDAAVLVPAGDPGALADALRLLVGDRRRVLELRRAAWDLAGERFLPATVVTPLVEHLRGVLSEAPSARRAR